MRKMKNITLFICSICFIFVFVGYMISLNKEKKYTKNVFYKEGTSYNDNIETINKQEKISINTKIILTDKYLLCNHEIDNIIGIDQSNINKSYEEIENIYRDYIISEFNSKYVKLRKEINQYCPFHYVLKSIDDKIGIYIKKDEYNMQLLNILDINLNSLRKNDKQLFTNEGLEIYGQKQLYEFIEDFDS